MIRVGLGYDSHRLVAGRDLWLGGVRIDYPLGLLGHSDADVVIHAVCDALLGAANMRDIGYHFPDNDPSTEGIASAEILRHTMTLLANHGYSIGNIDITIIAQAPKLAPYIPAMQQALAAILHTNTNNVSVKATTNEHMGFIGRQEGIAALATAVIQHTCPQPR